jgi:excisionase family DNA binding protein
VPDIITIEPDGLYTAAEVAKYLKLPDEKTVRRMALSGHLRSVRVGKRTIRFLGADVLAYVKQGGNPVPHVTIPDQVRRRPRSA